MCSKSSPNITTKVGTMVKTNMVGLLVNVYVRWLDSYEYQKLIYDYIDL